MARDDHKREDNPFKLGAKVFVYTRSNWAENRFQREATIVAVRKTGRFKIKGDDALYSPSFFFTGNRINWSAHANASRRMYRLVPATVEAAAERLKQQQAEAHHKAWREFQQRVAYLNASEVSEEILTAVSVLLAKEKVDV